MIIAERVLQVRIGKAELAVPISIHAPVDADRCWECRFEIAWPGEHVARVVRGEDGVQALYLAMERIALELYGSEQHRTGALRWTEAGSGYGFPMAKAGYTDLIGDDRTAQV